MFELIISLTLLEAACSEQIAFHNNFGRTVWVGSLGILGQPAPNNGGFKLEPSENKIISTGEKWSGTFWARTGCSFDSSGYGFCETGNCDDKEECAGENGIPPITHVEMTFNSFGGLDFYDVSFIDGYNIGVEIQPVHDTPDPQNPHSCGIAGCRVNLNIECPPELRLNNSLGQTVACKSACLLYNTEQCCCYGQYNSPETCKPDDWPVNSAKYFNSHCPDAYSYNYDDKAIYSCNDTAYRVIFW